MKQTLPITFILAQPHDLDSIYSLCQSAAKAAVYSKWGEDYPTKALLQNDIATRYLYKLEKNGKIYAIVKIMPWAEFQKNEEAEDIDTWDASIQNPCSLGRFCLSPALQGQGYGRKIVAYTMEFAKSLGYDGAFFHAVKDDKVCLHLYDTMGYNRKGEIFEYNMTFVCYEHKF